MNFSPYALQKNFFASLFLLIPAITLSQQGDQAEDLLLQHTHEDALQRLWNETTARWEINQQRIALFNQKQPQFSRMKDDHLIVQLMGFSKRGEPIYYQTYNLNAAKALRTNHLWSDGLSDLNLNGEGIRLNIWDGGDIRHTHQEFGSRTTLMDNAPYMVGHATHVAGTMVSAGIRPEAKGMAPAAELHVYDFNDDESEMIEAAANGAILSNHSYGRPTGWLFNLNQWWWYGDTRISEIVDYKFGYYSQETSLRDEITYLAPYYLQVHAAGNDRIDTGPEPGEEYNVFDHDLGVWIKSTDYREPDCGYDGYDCITGLVMGKNVITVGSVMDVTDYTSPESVVLSEFSSTGPADDGRIKPDVVANGQSLISTWVDNNTSYVGLTGTSMAAPTITGSLGLIQQLNKRLYNSYLRAATLKALMIHTTREAGEHPGPDYLHGWGLADMETAAKLLPGKDNTTIIQERNLVQNVVPSYTRTVYSTGQQPLVATLAWSDVPGTPAEPALNDRTPMLVNDLDLRVTRLEGGEVFYPWKLDPDNPTAPATQGDNIVDNVEKIEIHFPEPGEYLVEVTHKGEIADPVNTTNKRQAFSLVISGIAERETDLAITNAVVHDDGCNFTIATPSSIALANFGQQDASDITVYFHIKDPQGTVMQYDSVMVDELIAGTDTILDVFTDLSQGLEFEFSAWVNHPGDQLPANNSYTRILLSENWLVSEETYHTSFENISALESISWQVINNNDNDSGWGLRIGSAESQWASDGLNSMRYGVFNPDEGVETMEEADDWLITTCFYLLEGENYRLRFDYRSWNSDAPEKMRVMFGTSTIPEEFTHELLDLGSFAMDEFETASVTFTPEEEGTYYLAFHVYSPEDHRFVYLDNVFLERMVYADLAPVSIEVDAEGCDFSAETPVHIRFANLGMDPQQDFDVKLRLNHLASQTESTLTHHVDQLLEPGEEASHTFLANMDLYGEYQIDLITLLEGDENPQNDTLSVMATNTSINLEEENYFTNFDDISGFEELGWSTHSNSPENVGWRLNTLSGQAYTPPNSINMYRFGGDPDDWVFNNCMSMEEDTWYRIKFFKATRGTNAQEYFSIHLLEQPDPDQEVAMIGEVFINTFDYVDDEIVFQAPYTGDFHIGLFTDYTGPNTFQIFVDNFAVERVLEFDAAVTDIIQQTYGCNAFTAETPVKVVIENKGFEELQNAEVVLYVEDEQGNTDSYTLTSSEQLSLAQQDTLQFFADLSQYNTIYTLTAEIILESDEDTTNNEYSVQMRNTTVDLTAGHVYFNDFEMAHVDGHSRLVDPKTGWWYENSNNDHSEDGSPITWVMRKNAPFAQSGEISMRSGRSLVNDADDWLFSNCFIMQEGENYLLDFYYTGRTTSAEEKLSVYLGTEQNSQSMDEQVWKKTFSTGLDYQQAVVAITPPADGFYYIGFHAHSDADQGWIYLDDFQMQKNYETDISLTSIDVLEESCNFAEETPIRIHFRNSGNEDLEHEITVSYQITNPVNQIIAQEDVVIDDLLAVNQTGYMDIYADLRMYGKYSLVASVSLPEEVEEAETGNNTGSLQVFSTALNPEAHNVYISFEQFDNFEQTDWSVYDANNDGFTWDLGVNFTTFAYSGNRVMYYSFSATNHADDWLFSACANLMADTVYNASYFYRVFSGDYPENLQFAIASAPHPDSILQVFNVKEDLDNYNYRNGKYAFSVEEDGQYYFAWYAFSEKYHRFIFMDDFMLQKANTIDAAVHSIEPLADACDYDELTPLGVTVSNLGTGTLPSATVKLVITGPDNQEQEVSVSTPLIDVLSSEEVVVHADLTKPGRYTIHYSLETNDDEPIILDEGSQQIFSWAVDLAAPGKWHLQDFESIFALRETGWSIHNLNNDNRYWGLRVNDPGLAHSGQNYVVYFTGNAIHAANDWVISGCYELEGGRTYKAAVHYLLGSGNHNLRMAWGQEASPTNMDQAIWEETGMTANPDQEYEIVSGIMQAPQTGHYFFGIHQFSPAGQGGAIIDDFVVIAQPDILPLDVEEVYTGMELEIHALGSDSLLWFSDPELTQQIGQGTTLHYTITQDETFLLFAAEHFYGITGPADTLTVSFPVGTDETVQVAPLTVYPNPATETLRIDVPVYMKGELYLHILNSMGEVVQALKMEDKRNFILDVSHLPKGTYLINLGNTMHQLSARFVKM